MDRARARTRQPVKQVLQTKDIDVCVLQGTKVRIARMVREKTILLEQDPPYHKKDGGLFLYPPSPTSKDGGLVIQLPFYETLKLRKRFKLPWIVSLAMQLQASCKQSIKDSFQILRPINVVHVVHQIGGVLCNPPTTKHGGSSSSALVMTTSHS